MSNKPVINGESTLDHIGALRSGQLGYLVHERHLGGCEYGLDSRHTRISSITTPIILLFYARLETAPHDILELCCYTPLPQTKASSASSRRIAAREYTFTIVPRLPPCPLA